MEPILKLSEVSVRYEGHTVLDRIAFSIFPGEKVVLTGASGAGKSTLALRILGALPREASSEGVVTYGGRHIGAVFQEPLGALHPMLTVGSQVIDVARVRCTAKEARGAARAALRDAGLDEERVFPAWPYQLSGGERQRVLIAQAIVGRPELIVADEPTASLDEATAAGVIGTLRALDCALLFITHRPEAVKGLEHRLQTLREGRLLD